MFRKLNISERRFQVTTHTEMYLLLMQEGKAYSKLSALMLSKGKTKPKSIMSHGNGNRISSIVMRVCGHIVIETSSSDRTHSSRFIFSPSHLKTKPGPVSGKVERWTQSKFQSRLPIYIYKTYLSPGRGSR